MWESDYDKSPAKLPLALRGEGRGPRLGRALGGFVGVLAMFCFLTRVGVKRVSIFLLL